MLIINVQLPCCLLSVRYLRRQFTQVYGFLKTNELLSPNQFGFREKLSTAVALARFTDTILDNMDDGQLTRVAFLDLSKAFDTVNHSRLILKQDTCRGVHSACRREVNRHKLDICILRLRQGQIQAFSYVGQNFLVLK